MRQGSDDRVPFETGHALRHLFRLALILSRLWRLPAPSPTTQSLWRIPSSIWWKCRSAAGRTRAARVQLPVWNALYQVRDFAQYVNWVRAKDRAGRPLTVRELDKSRWQISGAEGGAVVEYQIYVDSFGPFGAQLNSHHAFFNLAQLLMYPVDARNEPMVVRFSQVPEGWHIATPLLSSPDGRFSAENYDRLVDSPVEIGTFQESDFDEGGGHYRVVVDAESGDYDMEKIDAMLHKIVAAATSWMDDRPFDTYMFLYHFPRGPGGWRHGAFLLNRDRCECGRALAISGSAGFGDGARVFSSVEREAHPSANAGAGGLHKRKLHAGALVQRRLHQHGRGHHPVAQRTA